MMVSGYGAGPCARDNEMRAGSSSTAGGRGGQGEGVWGEEAGSGPGGGGRVWSQWGARLGQGGSRALSNAGVGPGPGPAERGSRARSRDTGPCWRVLGPVRGVLGSGQGSRVGGSWIWSKGPGSGEVSGIWPAGFRVWSGRVQGKVREDPGSGQGGSRVWSKRPGSGQWEGPATSDQGGPYSGQRDPGGRTQHESWAGMVKGSRGLTRVERPGSRQ